MKTLLLVCTLLAAGGNALACGVGWLEESCKNVLLEDPVEVQAAIDELRACGQTGLDVLVSFYKEDLAKQFTLLTPAEERDRRRKIRHAVDQVAQQRDADRSRLFWHTDLQAARTLAEATGKPILSLRLLGGLDDELSCANSRMFRTLLYPDEGVSALLREQFVLHWETVRPVPTITIDFGDGRAIERTITGNSVHYLLAPNGQPVDLLPGVYSAESFRNWLHAGRSILAGWLEMESEERAKLVHAYHQDALGRLDARWMNLVPTTPWPDVRKKQILAVWRDDGLSVQTLTATEWNDVAQAMGGPAMLGPASRAMVAAKHPTAREAGRRAMCKVLVEDPILVVLDGLGQSVALDEAHNEFALHRQVHRWFVEQVPAPDALPDLNARVYRELFLMPEDDPWLGLGAETTFTGLEGRGIRQDTQRPFGI